LRDEAHRFGINFHRDKRSTDFITSELNSINGIGEKTAIKLLKEFKSVKSIKEQTLINLTKSVGMSKAQTVYSYFHK
jgi:excinuclease ABC subunit C